MKSKAIPKRTVQWFLDAAIQDYVPLFLLTHPSQLAGEIVNFPRHDFAEADIVKTLLFLFHAGYIEVVDQAEPPHDAVAVEALLRRDIAGYQLFSQGSYYRLTALGASYWEDMAKPDWNRFHSRAQTSCGRSTPSSLICWRVESANRELLEEVLKLPPLLWPMIPGTDRWQEESPWRATYWKTFPRGYMVTLTCLAEHASLAWSLSQMTPAAKKRYRELYLRKWYQSTWR